MRFKFETEVKLMSFSKVISHGESYTTFSNYFQVGESSVREAVLDVAHEVLQNEDWHMKVYWPLTKCNVQKGTKLHNNQHIVNKMMGCMDCIDVQWENFTYALCGQ